MEFNCDFPYEFEQVVLTHHSDMDNGQRTFKLDMIITDQDAVFLTQVLVGFKGQIIGYRLISAEVNCRSFARVLNVDTETKKITICPVDFKSQRTEAQPLITEYRSQITSISIMDIADVVAFKSEAQAKIEIVG